MSEKHDEEKRSFLSELILQPKYLRGITIFYDEKMVMPLFTADSPPRDGMPVNNRPARITYAAWLWNTEDVEWVLSGRHFGL